jgi:hypothetical protein
MSDGDCMIRPPKSLIKKRLVEGLGDIRQGRVHGPFRAVTALLRSLHRTKKAENP